MMEKGHWKKMQVGLEVVMSFQLFHLVDLTSAESQLQSSESASAMTLEGCTAAMPLEENMLSD